MNGPSDARLPAREELYPIRTVATLTGVNPVTLRAWERRYGLVRPRRAPSGHRLYSRDDVNLLRRVVALLEEGVPIGRAGALLEAQRESPAQAPTRHGEPDRGWSAYTRRMLEAVVRFDESALNGVYNEALALYPADLFHEHAVVALLRLLGERWSQHRGGIAEEHFFSTYLRNKLGARLHHLSAAPGACTLVAACMPDDRHELGLLVFSHGASVRGYRVVVLGAAVPLGELAPAVRAAGAHALVLSMSVAPGPGVLDDGLAALVREVRVPVLVGGACSQDHAGAIEAAGAGVIGNSVPAALATIDRLLGTAPTAPV